MARECPCSCVLTLTVGCSARSGSWRRARCMPCSFFFSLLASVSHRSGQNSEGERQDHDETGDVILDVRAMIRNGRQPVLRVSFKMELKTSSMHVQIGHGVAAFFQCFHSPVQRVPLSSYPVVPIKSNLFSVYINTVLLLACYRTNLVVRIWPSYNWA